MIDVAAAFNRAYPARALAQQQHDRLVHSQAELVRVLGLALAGAPEVSTIRLGADIYLDAPLVLAGDYSCVIDGGGHYAIGGSPAFTGTELLQVAGVSNLLFRNLRFVGPSTKLERLIALNGSATALCFDGVALSYIKRIHQGSGTNLYTNSYFTDVRMGNLSLTDVTDIGTAQYVKCQFVRCYAALPSGTIRVIDVTDGPGSTHLVAFEAGSTFASTSAIVLKDFDISQLYRLKISKDISVNDGSSATAATGYSQLLQKTGATSWVLQGSGTTSGAVSITVASFTPSVSKSYLVTMRMVGRRTNGADPGQTDTWIISQQYKTSSTGVVTAGAVLTNNFVQDDATWAAAIDSAAGDIRMRAGGVAAVNITWATTTTIDEV